MRASLRALATAALCAGAFAFAAPAPPVLFQWERGLGLRIPAEPSADMFLWFYEWTMFEAMQAGQHTHGSYQFDRTVNAAGTEATIDSPAFHLTVRVVADGAELGLRVTNRTNYAWPDIAGIIPCWNPGQLEGTNPSAPLPLNRNFADPSRDKTFFATADGLAPLNSCALHFLSGFRAAAERSSDRGAFAFSAKWPTSDVNAAAGLLIRESEDRHWVTAIAWEDALCVQGHNPWSCMHTCVRVGALKPNESRTIRGKLYLFRGTKEECWARFQADFPRAR